MKFQTMKSVTEAGPGRFAISFIECDHVRIRKAGDLVQSVVNDPGQMIGQTYPCNECEKGFEE